MAQKLNEDIKDKITEFLKNNQYGASSSEIAKGINRNRITVSKYLEIMHVSGLIDCKNIAQAKIWTISKKHLKKKILVVDDEPLIINLIKLSLKQDKYDLLEATNGQDAISIAANHKPHIMILDVMMPGLDGFEVCKRLKQDPKTSDIKIIILSAKSEQDNKIKGMDYGADDYLTKPFDPSELDSMIESLIFMKEDEKINSITGLGNKKALNIILDKRKDIKELLEITINNFSEYKNKYGKNNSDKILKLLARLFKDKVKDDMKGYVSHVKEDQFVVITRLGNIKQEILESFEYILPYIYHKKQDENKIDLEFSEVKIRK